VLSAGLINLLAVWALSAGVINLLAAIARLHRAPAEITTRRKLGWLFFGVGSLRSPLLHALRRQGCDRPND
jgi:hypothetical protein